jgi:DNA-binding transcriptional MerR regulator
MGLNRILEGTVERWLESQAGSMAESLKESPRLRPADLARRHGLSTQAVRNYEGEGFLPSAERTTTGYRIYTDRHALALDAYLALINAHGHATAGVIMRAVNAGDLDAALRAIDESHGWLQRDRQTLDTVRAAVDVLAAGPAERRETTRDDPATPYSIGALAHRLGVTAATLRAWERAGILNPRRDPATGHRWYDAEDRRDADLARLLRRGGERLDRIAVVVGRVRGAGSIDAVAGSLAAWQARITRRGLAMIDADRRLADYLDYSHVSRRAVETDTKARH